MSIDEIKALLALLPTEQQERLSAYLTHLRHRRDAITRMEVTRRNSEWNPLNWITTDELRAHWEK